MFVALLSALDETQQKLPFSRSPLKARESITALAKRSLNAWERLAGAELTKNVLWLMVISSVGALRMRKVDSPSLLAHEEDAFLP